jgi:hypothetical protein
LRGAIDSIVDFGCWSAEPFALLWILNAIRIEVVELEEVSLTRPKQVLANLKRCHAQCLEGRQIEFHPPQDMMTIELASSSFDLAYCKRLLTNLESDTQIQSAINKMAGVVRAGGWVIAVESMPDDQGNPRPREDIVLMFKKAGLEEEHLVGGPEDAYCFRKPSQIT